MCRWRGRRAASFAFLLKLKRLDVVFQGQLGYPNSRLKPFALPACECGAREFFAQGLNSKLKRDDVIAQGL